VTLELVRPTPGAVALLEVCALLGPDEIPRELFSQQLDPPAQGLEVLAGDPFLLDDAVAALRRFGLVTADEQVVTMHRLLQQVVRDQLDPSTKTIRVGVAVRLVDEGFPAVGHEDPGVWPVCAQLLPHALAATTHAEQGAVEAAATGELLDRAAGYLLGRAQYKEARVLRERALALAETAFGPMHEITANRLSYLGYLLMRAGEPTAALPLLERSLTIYEAVLPADPGVATTLDNLGVTLRHLGDSVGARTHLQSALAIREAHLGRDHPDTARSLHNLANVLHDQRDLDEAYSMCQRALATPTPPAVSIPSPASCTVKATSAAPADSMSAPSGSTRLVSAPTIPKLPIA
jgi:tetratricopeptide (TPR) repeat protein